MPESYSSISKKVDGVDYTFDVPAFAGDADAILERYGYEEVVDAFVKAKFPAQTVAQQLKDGKAQEQVQEWLNSWRPGSRQASSPRDKLLRAAEAIGPDALKAVQEALAKVQASRAASPKAA